MICVDCNKPVGNSYALDTTTRPQQVYCCLCVTRYNSGPDRFQYVYLNPSRAFDRAMKGI
jgi:hypothetical protein